MPGRRRGPNSEIARGGAERRPQLVPFRLSHRDRVLFLGRYWYGSPYKELAQQTGLTENNAMVRVSRLREKLRAHLKKKGVLE